jgi:hypothetical protein
VNLLPETIEDLARNEFKACIDVDEALRNVQFLIKKAPQRCGVSFGVVIASWQFHLRGFDRLIGRLQWVLT